MSLEVCLVTPLLSDKLIQLMGTESAARSVVISFSGANLRWMPSVTGYSRRLRFK